MSSYFKSGFFATRKKDRDRTYRNSLGIFIGCDPPLQ